MWETFLKSWNGKNFFLNQFWESSTSLRLYTDASGSVGFGGIHGSQWFQGRWASHQSLGVAGISIAWQELYAIVVACYIWGAQWKNKRVLFYCDNAAVVAIVNTKKSKGEQIMKLVRSIKALTLKYNFYFKAKHVAGARNEIADSLSRFQVERFRQLAPWADRDPQPIAEVVCGL